MQNSVNPKLKFDYQQLGSGAAPGSPAGVLSVAFRAQFSLIQFFKQPGQYAFAFPRREAPELCMKRSPNRGRGECRMLNAPTDGVTGSPRAFQASRASYGAVCGARRAACLEGRRSSLTLMV